MSKSLVLQEQRMRLLQKATKKIKPSGLMKYQFNHGLVRRKRGNYQNMYWLLDTSGSMAGDKIWQLIDTVQYLLQKYPNVNLVTFNSAVQRIDEARIPHLVAAGSTAMLEALELAWSCNPDCIVLVSDGEPMDAPPGGILDIVAAHHTDVPINTIGIGEHYNRDFLDELSELTKGSFAECGSDELDLLTDKFEEVLMIEKKDWPHEGGPIAL